MPITKDELVDVLRVRYDAYSAEAVFTTACVRAGLDGTTSFDTRSLATFRDALERVGDRVGGVLARIDAMLADGSPAANVDAKPEVKADAKPEGKGGGKPKKGDAKPEAKADAKPDAKADAKADAAANNEATIVLRGVELDDGEEVLVCGAHAAIGDWEPERARPMTRAGAEWQATFELPPDAEVAFKFLRRDSDGDVTWESGANRVVRASERLDATWREL
jgi:hypothetical protein